LSIEEKNKEIIELKNNNSKELIHKLNLSIKEKNEEIIEVKNNYNKLIEQ
jgi:hypothetical protein